MKRKQKQIVANGPWTRFLVRSSQEMLTVYGKGEALAEFEKFLEGFRDKFVLMQSSGVPWVPTAEVIENDPTQKGCE